MPRVLFILCATLVLARPAYAQRSDHERGAHAAGIVFFGGLFLAIEFPANASFASRTCWWCAPTSVDIAVRDALVWKNHPDAARIASDIVGFGGTALVLSGMLFTAAGDERSGRRLFDDAIPMVESAIVGGILQSTVKYLVRRHRPFARHAQPGRAWHYDDHNSFWSGHTASVFAEAVSAGLVARERGYRMEPAIWATGLTLAATTGYLRIAADKHYVTDVLVGAVLGAATGAIVTLLHRNSLQPSAQTTQAPGMITFGARF